MCLLIPERFHQAFCNAKSRLVRIGRNRVSPVFPVGLKDATPFLERNVAI